MPGLALAYLRDRALTTLLNVLLLGLAVATLVILLVFSTQIGNRFERDAAGVDLVVGAKGSPLQLILASLYQLDAPTGNVPLESVEMLRRDQSVALAVPLALGDNFRGYRIVGTEPAYLGLYEAELARGEVFAGTGEAVIGAEVARATGMDLGQQFVGSHGLSGGDGAGEHAHAPFRAVGILEPTGSVIDRLIIVSLESVWDAHGIAHGDDDHDHDHDHDHGEDGHDHEGHDHEGHDHDGHDHEGHDHDGHDHDGHDQEGHEHEGDEHEHDGATTTGGTTGPTMGGADHAMAPEVTAILVKYRNAMGAVRLPGQINRQTNMQAAVPAIETTRLLQFLGSGIEGARLFAWLLALTGGLSIFVALLQAARAREGELALLRVMGATRMQVFGTIVTEGLLIAIAGSVIGLVGGHLAMAAAVSSFDRLREIGLDPWSPHPGELAIVAAVLAIGVIAALIPAMRVFRKDLAVTLASAR